MSALTSQNGLVFLGFFGGPLETRTPDPLIKSLGATSTRDVADLQ